MGGRGTCFDAGRWPSFVISFQLVARLLDTLTDQQNNGIWRETYQDKSARDATVLWAQHQQTSFLPALLVLHLKQSILIVRGRQSTIPMGSHAFAGCHVPHFGETAYDRPVSGEDCCLAAHARRFEDLCCLPTVQHPDFISLMRPPM